MRARKGFRSIGGQLSRRRGRFLTAVLTFAVVLLLLVWRLAASSDDAAPRPAPSPSSVTDDPAKVAAHTGEVPANPFITVPTREASYNEVVRAGSTEEVTITHAISDGVEMLFPFMTLRDRVGAPEGRTPNRWRSKYMPRSAYQIPTWASPAEKNTLRHASIFVSIAAFRDAECATTLQSALMNAASPHRIYAGISEERRLSDTSCLTHLQLGDGIGGNVARRLLYGAAAPPTIQVRFTKLTWADVLRDPATGRATNLSIERATAGVGGVPATREAPAGVYMEDAFMAADTITCVYSALERERDRVTLGARADAGLRARRVRRGLRPGPQEHLSGALAGCRVVARVTPERGARGPTFGRYVTSLFYAHQDYYMMVDSHSRFSVDWDLKMIARVFQMGTRGVMSHYPNGYTPDAPEKEYEQAMTMSMCKGVILANGMPKLGAQWMKLSEAPVVAAFAAAGYMFGDAQFALDVPFDPFLPYLFDGEEILYSARVWTSGWDHYAPGEPNIFHHYLRKDTPKFWSLVRRRESALRQTSERRALFLLERSFPWVEVLLRMGKADPKEAAAVPFVPPSERRIVSTAEADRVPMIGIERWYYGMGRNRTLEAYWDHTQLTDNFVRTKDKENRWEGGMGLCSKLS